MWQEQELNQWVDAIRRGEVTAAPAEGLYGYVADPFNSQALEKVVEIKRRSPQKGIIVLIADPSHLDLLCPRPLPTLCNDAVLSQWPGAVTLILPALSTLPSLLTGGRNTIAVRCPSEVYMLEYLNKFSGPLISTSLNESGRPPATQAAQLPANLPALALPHALSGTPSRIYDPMQNKWLR